MSWQGPERWLQLWRAMHAQGDPLPWYERLRAAYSEPQRHYHNQQHITECLAEFDGARHLVRQPEAVETAIWFHDVIYKPRGADNEEQSAALAVRCLVEADVSPALSDTVAHLVMATKSHNSGADADTAVMIDVDLSILGQKEKRFLEYEAQIRKEYAWVPRIIFAPKRKQILEGFLKRERIYATDFFHAKYDANARRNLQLSINTILGKSRRP